MKKKSTCNKLFIILSLFLINCLLFFGLSGKCSAQENESVELNGDVIEYSIDGNKVIAEGNVEIIYKGMTLKADKVEFHRTEKIAYAKGNVRLITKDSEIRGDDVVFNYDTMKGDLNKAKIYSNPFFGFGEKIKRINENKIVMEQAYMTTSDYDRPGFRFTSPYVEVYPGDKLIAHNAKMVAGKVPLFYIPRFTQDLKKKKPWLILVPGYDKDWGIFLLTKLKPYVNENLDLTLHFDLRERKDFASGFDLGYKTDDFGSGLIRTYYMNERNLGVDRFYEERTVPTIERERYKIEWRHKWKMDDRTNTVLQYYKISDSTFLKDYFENEYESDTNPNTYFVLTRALTLGTLSFSVEPRVNRFNSQVERLPEIRYDVPNNEILDTNFYIKNTTTYSNLTNKTASPSEVRQNTMRFDINNELSYPTKISFIEFKPFVGHQHTYYSKTKDPSLYDSIRGQFRTGSSLSTKFYKFFNIFMPILGMDDTRMRHIISPNISYLYKNNPTISSTSLDYFDDTDILSKTHTITVSLENKLQIKRKNKTVDLLRSVISSPYALKDDPNPHGFEIIDSDWEFRPIDWLSLYADFSYNTKYDRLNTANFDLYVNGKKWSLGLGKRFNREVDDQVTAAFRYNVNRKWSFEIYDRFDLNSGILKEQQYIIKRDLHSWDLEMMFNQTRDKGSEILLVFTLKAFPDITIDAGTSLNKSKRVSTE